MPRLLHILTTRDDPFAEAIIVLHRQLPDQEVKVVDLTNWELDYHVLLEEIFAADSVQVW